MANVTQLKRSSPEAEGIPSTAVLDFIRAVEQPFGHPLDAVQGFMLLRHGNVVAEGWWTPCGPQSPHSLYSLSKSFTSTGIGLAVAEGLLHRPDEVQDRRGGDALGLRAAALQLRDVCHGIDLLLSFIWPS